ncbi:MAG: DUF4349 domain-containing protein [Treponema sp.]|nr:DUF4349 domain-containing protein [Treponema sp.]
MKHVPQINFILPIISALFLICACSQKSAYGASAYDWEEADYSRESRAYLEQAVPAAYGGGPGLNGRAGNADNSGFFEPFAPDIAGQSRKLVKRAEIRIRVEDPEATERPLAELMEKYGAWPASAGISENSRSYSIRVPSGSYEAMLSELAGLGRILGRTESAEDVTLRYYDLESRLATKRELLKTYQGYLGKAENIDDIMTVESRIADLQQEIDQTGTQFRSLASLVDYSTINIDIYGPVAAPSFSEPGIGEKLKVLFGSFGRIASSALVILTGIIIYGIPAVLIFVLLVWVLFGRIGLLKKLMRLALGKKAKSN